MSNFLQQKNLIDEWLKAHKVSDYTIVENSSQSEEIDTPWVVNTDWEVDLTRLKLSFIPVKFNRVAGNFLCSMNELTSLIFAPRIVGGYFACSYNKLTSLEYAPISVGGEFYCHRNELTSLKGAPKEICGDFNCRSNHLTTLEFPPKDIWGDFICSENQLTTLEFCPQSVGKKFYCDDNPGLAEYEKLTSFKEVLVKREALELQKKLKPVSINENKLKTSGFKI